MCFDSLTEGDRTDEGDTIGGWVRRVGINEPSQVDMDGVGSITQLRDSQSTFSSFRRSFSVPFEPCSILPLLFPLPNLSPHSSPQGRLCPWDYPGTALGPRKIFNSILDNRTRRCFEMEMNSIEKKGKFDQMQIPHAIFPLVISFQRPRPIHISQFTCSIISFRFQITEYYSRMINSDKFIVRCCNQLKIGNEKYIWLLSELNNSSLKNSSFNF